MQTQQNRRRNYFIDRRFQSKYIGIIISLFVIVGLFVLLMVMLFSGQKEVTDESQIVQWGYVNVVIPLLVVFLIVVVFTIVYGIKFSHRIVGPIYAFNRHLNWIKEGIYSRDLQLREKDEFKNLARVFNATQNALRQRAENAVGTCELVEGHLDELGVALQGEIDSAKAQEMIKAIKEELSSLREKNKGYTSQP